MSPDLEDRALQNLDNELLLEVYRYSYGRLELKHKKRWALIEKFHEQFLDWVEKEEEDTQRDVLESSKLVLREILLFRTHFIDFQNSMVECFQTEKGRPIQMETMKNRWRRVLTHAYEILENSSACEYWASKVAADGKPPVFNHRIHLMMI